MNHPYFASLLENYRRRMGMDSSVLSIRKALLESYQNESYKLRERQRHAMAKQRREEIESDRIFRNRMKEIKEKEREISKRYENLRKRNARNASGRKKNDFTKYYQNYFHVMEGATLARKPSVYLETDSNVFGKNLANQEAANTVTKEDTDSFSAVITGWRTERSTAAKNRRGECHIQIPLEKDTLTKPTLQNCSLETGRFLSHLQKREMQHSKPPSARGSIFANRLIEYYRNGESFESHQKFHPVVEKTTRTSTNAKRNGSFNVTSPGYDILVIDNEDDSCV